MSLSFLTIVEEDRVKYLLPHKRTERESDISTNFCSAAYIGKKHLRNSLSECRKIGRTSKSYCVLEMQVNSFFSNTSVRVQVFF